MNIQEVHTEVRSKWIAEEAPSVPVAVRFGSVVDWSIMLVWIAAFVLSAAHTVRVFGIIAPGVAGMAPVMIEVGLSYVAFRAKKDAAYGRQQGKAGITLIVLLVLAAFVSNLVGGLVEAQSSAGQISNLSGQDVFDQFQTLPMTVQGGLIVAILMAFIVPAVSIVAGESVAAHLFDTRRGETDFIEQRWREVEREFLYRAVFAKLNGDGLPAKEAARIAQAEVRAYLAPVDPGRLLMASTPPSTKASIAVSTPPSTARGRVDAPASRRPSTRPSTPVLSTPPSTVDEVDAGGQWTVDKSEAIRGFLAENPQVVGLSITELHRLLASNGVDASRALVGRVAKEFREQTE